MSSRILVLDLPGRTAQKLTWPLKSPADTMPYGLDAADLLQDGNLRLLDAAVSQTGGAQVVAKEDIVTDGSVTGVLLHIAAGNPGTTETFAVTLVFDRGATAVFLVSLPIGPALPEGLQVVSPAAPADALRVAGLVLTVAGAPVDLPDTTPSPVTVAGLDLTVGGEPILP